MKKQVNRALNLITLLIVALLLAGCNFSRANLNPGGPWYVDPAGDDSADCLSAATACATIQAAVGKADPGGTVIIAAGTYPETLNLSKAINLEGAGVADTIVDAQRSGRAATVTMAEVRLQDLSLVNGDDGSLGGGLANMGAELELTDVKIANSTAPQGGGLVNIGTLTMTRVELSGNSALRGAGLYNASNEDNQLTEVDFRSNTADEAGGGLFNGGQLAINSSTLAENSAHGDGGAIFNDTSGNLTVIDSLIESNHADGGYSGGGFYNRGNLELTVTELQDNSSEWSGGAGYNAGSLISVDSRYQGNMAEEQGGALFNTMDLNLSGGDLRENVAPQGGGLFNQGTAVVSSATLAANSGSVGGAIFNSEGLLEMTGAEVRQNQVDGGQWNIGGAGVANIGGTVTIKDSTLVDNQIMGIAGLVKGGALYNSRGSARIENSTFRGNVAPGGGAISVESGDFELLESTLDDNHAFLRGGAISIYPTGIAPGPQTARIEDSTLSNNTSDGRGGAIYASDFPFELFRSRLSDNAAGGDGGAIHTQAGMIQDSTLVGNSATRGGAVFVGEDNEGPTLLNSTLSGNQAEQGGAVFVFGGFLHLDYSTVAQNSTSQGGALQVASGFNRGGLATPLAALLADNDGPNCAGSIIDSLAANLSDDGSCPFNNSSDQQNSDPQLGPLQDNGGPTQTHALASGSPALDMDSCHNVSADQRAEPRPAGTACDSGSFELQEGLAVSPPPDEGAVCEAAVAFEGAEFSSIAHRAERGGVLVVLDVPGELTQTEYEASISGAGFTCNLDADFPGRMFCVGPRLTAGVGAEMSVYAEGCSQPVYETSFSVPLDLYPTPTPTVTPPSIEVEPTLRPE